MKRIIEFCKKRYKILIPIAVVFVLLLTVFFLYREYRYDNYRDKKEIKVYQYFAGKKREYTAIVTYNLKKNIIDIEAKDEDIKYDSTPIYYQKKDMIIFPADMTIVFPLEGGTVYRLNKYTSYGMKDEVHKIISGNESKAYNHFFLSDGKGLYFFSDGVTLDVDGRKDINLSAGSYAQVIGGYTLVYYDRESDTSEVIDVTGNKIMAVNDNVKVDLADNAFYVFGKRSLVNQPYALNPLLGN